MGRKRANQIKTQDKNRAVIYCRYSTDQQREESIEDQLREAKKHCDTKGYTIIGNYLDPAISGRSDDRPEFQRMISDAQKGLFDVIVIYKYSRFSRRIRDSYKYKAILSDNGVRIESIYEKIDNTPTGVVMEAMYISMAESYSLSLAEDTLRGLKGNALVGKNTGGKPALGYDVDSKTKNVHNK